MPASKNQKRDQKYGFNSEFVNRTLNELEKSNFLAWITDKKFDLDAHIEEMFSQGYKISLSWDDANDCFIASMSTRFEKSPNVNKVLTSRSDNWREAWALCLYKHEVLFDNGAWEVTRRSDNWG